MQYDRIVEAAVEWRQHRGRRVSTRVDVERPGQHGVGSQASHESGGHALDLEQRLTVDV